MAGSFFCSDCGTPLTATAPVFEPAQDTEIMPRGRQCPECGSMNESDAVRCSCGHDSTRPRSLVVRPEPADPSPEQKPDRDAQARMLHIEFSGSAGEYFRIWIVNLCLTLVTLGLFSAWAKVRKKRYFYSCTKLDGTPFQYLGRPIPILKGRLIAGAAFLAYYLSSHFFTSFLPYVFAAGLVFAPWVVVRASAFNARYSAFRNMTFYFDGTYRSALNALYAGGIIPAMALGTVFNWWGKPLAAGIAFIVFGLVFPW